MIAQSLLHDLAARGVILSANGDQLDVDAPDDALTDELLATLRAHKAELLALLRRPSLGSAVCPLTVRAQRLTVCPFDDCDTELSAQGDLNYCRNCDYWFQRIEPAAGAMDSLSAGWPDEGRKFVTTLDIRRAAERHKAHICGVAEAGDDHDASDAAEWVM